MTFPNAGSPQTPLDPDHNLVVSKVSVRSALRLLAVTAALTCGWLAIATEQKAHVPVCINATKGITHIGQAVPPQVSAANCALSKPIRTSPVGTTWLVGPTIAMSFAIVAAIVFGLLAISPRQGSLLTYRWRRAVY
jgi:hypothetical protein